MKNIKFINAGAGSGKTHRLTEVLAKWIEEGNNANEVILTTFTKKAAAEIRERAQSKLLENKKFSQANKLNEAFIGTVHSIGYQFIKKYWYLLGISPELTEISEMERDVFFSQAIGEVPTDEELKCLDELTYQFDFRDSNNFFNANKWKEDVLSLMNIALLNNIDIVQNKESLNHTQNRINNLFKGTFQNEKLNVIIKNIESILKNKGAESKRKPALMKCEYLSNVIANKNISLKILLEIGKLIDSLDGVYPDGSSKKNEDIRSLFPAENVQDFQLFKDAVIEYNELIFNIAQRSLSKYHDFKQEKGLVDYTDMEVNFLKLLEEEIVQKEISETIKMVMVDEFQDSNPIQLNIFMKLSLLTIKSYWVGDPKQAIYGFRGADPVLIDQVIKEFTKKNEDGLSIDLLKMSWRSIPKLVNFSNQIFEKRMLEQSSDIYLESKNQIHGPEEKEGDSNPTIVFNNWVQNREIHPLKKKDTIGLIPARNTSEVLSAPPIKFWNFLDIAKTGMKAATKENYFQKLAKKTASIIQDGTNGKFKIIAKETGNSENLKGSDICILMSSNKKVSELAEEFNKLGCAVNAIVDGLTDTVEYRIIQNIITLFLDTNNALSSSELAYLTGEEDSVNVLLEQRIKLLISELEKKEKDDKYNMYKTLNDWLKENEHKKSIEAIKQQSRHLSVYYTIQKITNQFNIFQKLLNFKNSELRQANVLKLGELAKDYETYCINMNLGSSLTGFLDFIESNKDYNIQAANTNSNAVNIMTYHKAKGLEWPMVILSDIDKKPLDKFIRYEIFSTRIINNKDLDISNPLKNRIIEFSFWPFGTSTSVNEKLKEQIEALPNYFEIESNKLNEASRLMYVGITRARDYLVFATNQYKNAIWLEDVIPNWKLEEALEEINFNTTQKVNCNLFNLEEECLVEYEKIMPDTEFDSMFIAQTENYFKKEIPVAQNKPYLRNPSKEIALTTCKVVLIKELHYRLTINTPDSTELGNTLHQFLYIKDRTYFKNSVEKSETLEELGVDKTMFIENMEKFNQYLKTNFGKFNQYPEISMEVKIGNQLAKGEADLVLETKEGLILIDYKSYAGNDDVTNSSCEFYAGKYSGQLELYSQMLESTFENKKVIKKLIYYVVQGKIVELK